MSRTYDIKVDNLGPLTTTFTAPSTCLETTTLVGSQAYYVAGFWDDVPECYPSGTASEYNFHTMPQYYSPGICPKDWVPVTSAGADYPSTASGYDQWAVDPKTHVWLCCPSGYTYWGIDKTAFYYTDSCRRSMLRGEHMTNLLTTASGEADLVLVPTATVSSSIRIDAKGIMIMWESTDSAVAVWASKATLAAAVETSSSSSSSRRGMVTESDFTSSSTTTPGGSSDRDAASTSPTESSTSSSQGSIAPASGGGGLSTGAKAGIGVGVAIGVLAILFLGFWLGRRRKAEPQASGAPGIGELHGEQKPVAETQTSTNFHETQSAPYFSELPQNQTAHQLPDNRRVYQLP